MAKKYTIHIEKDENGMFVGEVVGMPACYTQAKTIPQLLERIIEVSEWSMELLQEMKHSKVSADVFTLSLNVEYAAA